MRNISKSSKAVWKTNCLASVIRQLASILNQADQIFQELGSQCQQITERTVRVQARVATLRVDVDNFNPRKHSNVARKAKWRQS